MTLFFNACWVCFKVYTSYDIRIWYRLACEIYLVYLHRLMDWRRHTYISMFDRDCTTSNVQISRVSLWFPWIIVSQAATFQFRSLRWRRLNIFVLLLPISSHFLPQWLEQADVKLCVRWDESSPPNSKTNNNYLLLPSLLAAYVLLWSNYVSQWCNDCHWRCLFDIGRPTTTCSIKLYVRTHVPGLSVSDK